MTKADWLKALVTLLSAGLGAWIAAVVALNRWRLEMTGKRRAELAEDVLADFYRVQEILRWVRSPAGYAGEAKDRPKGEGEDPDLASVLDAYYIPLARLNENREFLSQFHARKYRFKAVFGAAGAAPFQEIRAVEAEFVTAASTLAMLARRARGRDHWDKKREDILWDTGEPNDAINRRVKAAIEAIETTCGPAIEAQSAAPPWTRWGARAWRGFSQWPQTDPKRPM
jgi:hypothetical protein